MKINLAKLLFDHLCFCIKESHNKAKAVIHHPRLISELIRQTRLIEILRAHEKLRVFNTAKLDASILANMKLKTKEEILKVKDPLKEVYETYFWCNGFPTISEADNEEVIKNFLQMVYNDTGVRIPREMVAGSPWDIYKSSKEVTRNRRKPITIEEDIVEPSEEKDSIDDMVDDEEASKAAEEQGDVSQRVEAETVEAQETTPERRTKKRHDRDPSDAEEQAQAQPSKKIKSRAPKHKGKTSKPTIKSSTDAQGLPPQTSSLPQTQTIPVQPTQPEQPDETIKPITMMLPNSTIKTCLISSNSSSSSSTNSDSSATESDVGSDPEGYVTRKLQKHRKKPISKPKVRTSHQPSSEPLNLTKEYNEENPLLDLLVSHASGDAFTSSALNTPVVSPSNFAYPISEHLNTPVHNSPTDNIIADEPPAEPITSEPPSSTPLPSDIPSSSHSDQVIPSIPSDQNIEDLNVIPIYQGPSFYPNTSFSIYFPLYEELLKERINVNDDFIPPNLSRIRIINLKRKQPEPAIPFNQTLPFFNSLHEPNLELLSTAINSSLKRFKCLDEEQLIYPSDIDAEILDLERKFSMTLKMLGGYVKERIKGRARSVIRQVFEAADHSCLLRITNYNHQEELLKQQQLLMDIQESLRTASQAVSALILEEQLYEQAAEAEQARIAAEAESQKLVQQQDVGPSDDIVMVDASPVVSAADKGKGILEGPSAPPSVVAVISPHKPIASDLPPAVLAALDDIRHEMRDEIDILRADLREDSQRVAESTNKRLDEISGSTNKRLDDMMELLLKLAKNNP
jgi:hypothetical protein